MKILNAVFPEYAGQACGKFNNGGGALYRSGSALCSRYPCNRESTRNLIRDFCNQQEVQLCLAFL